jgi:hypothetical protein
LFEHLPINQHRVPLLRIGGRDCALNGSCEALSIPAPKKGKGTFLSKTLFLWLTMKNPIVFSSKAPHAPEIRI